MYIHSTAHTTSTIYYRYSASNRPRGVGVKPVKVAPYHMYRVIHRDTQDTSFMVQLRTDAAAGERVFIPDEAFGVCNP